MPIYSWRAASPVCCAAYWFFKVNHPKWLKSMPAPLVIQALIGTDAARSFADSDGPSVGDRLAVRVLALAGSRRAVVSFGPFRALADVDFPVRAGDMLQVVVTQKDGGRIRFQIEDPGAQEAPQPGPARLSSALMSGSSAAANPGVPRSLTGSRPAVLLPPPSLPFSDTRQLHAEIARILLSDTPQSENLKVPGDILHSLANVQREIAPLEIGGSGTQLATKLKASVENAGFLFEKKLELLIRRLWDHVLLRSSTNFAEHPEIRDLMHSDLKPNLMLLKAFLDRPEFLTARGENTHLRFVQRSLDSLLQNIHHQQSRAATLKQAFDTRPEAVYLPTADSSAPHAETGPVQVFTYEFPLKEARQNARLKVYYPPRRSRDKAGGQRVSLLLSMQRMGDVRTDFFLYRRNLDITFFVKKAETKTRISRQLSRMTPALEPLFANLKINVVVSAKKIDAFETEDFVLATDRIVDYRA